MRSYRENPIPGVYMGAEIYVFVLLDNGDEVVSPIDIAFADKPFVKVMHQFQNELKEIEVLAPGGKFLEIWDIKTGGDYGFFDKYKDGVPLDHKLQFHIYMKGANLESLFVFNFHKQYAYVRPDLCVWEDEIWEMINDNQKRVNELVESYNKDKVVKFKKEDMKCFNDKSIDWYSCPWAFTKEEILPNNKPHLILDKPCLEMQELILEEAKKKFLKDSKWLRGSSHITILSVDDEEIISKNKSGKQYIDNYFYAYRNFKPMETK